MGKLSKGQLMQHILKALVSEVHPVIEVLWNSKTRVKFTSSVATCGDSIIYICVHMWFYFGVSYLQLLKIEH